MQKNKISICCFYDFILDHNFFKFSIKMEITFLHTFIGKAL